MMCVRDIADQFFRQRCNISCSACGSTAHLVTSTFVSRGRRGTISHPRSFCVAGGALMALGGALGPGLVARDAAVLCVAGVALGDIHLRFTWQAWRNLTSTFVSRVGQGPRETKVDVRLCHACHAKCRGVFV